jgi:hypothetical protein
LLNAIKNPILAFSASPREIKNRDLTLGLNIVSFDIPYPANYGGVIDVFYKVKELHKKGIKIHLHCFEYGRQKSSELEKYCEKVYYYPRKTGFLNNLSSLPYTVKSRISTELEKNLLSNDFPILFEVLHTCYLLDSPALKNRFKIFRHSNIEHDYYRHLAASEKNIFKRFYLQAEARKLEKFERILEHADLILAVSQSELKYFRDAFPKAKSEYLPSFHPNSEVTVKEGKGDFILYHGNLGISENYQAVEWLTRNVFSKTNYPVKIAGLNPPEFLKALCKNYANVELISSPAETEMRDLIGNAHIHLLYTEQGTGLKLKLLNVLHAGRFILCNSKMLEGTDIRSSQTIAVCNTPHDFQTAIESCFKQYFSHELSEDRKSQLGVFSNDKNAEKLIGFLKR